ncbi:helix-turn-helix domain-containing protein [Spirosoma pollinicola]|uniref:DNA-binding protein n=1 Tax=Spirosoma pollinicola TaxID=2057025 RepID=A0A2K8YX17_9BACT|nr:helix-turn-helix domain-containing protein [Spirosoma pollinicola]AUD02171.1 DNA-binding protein [Spirosoma pollinicola]
MQVICLEDKAFYALIDEVVARLKEKQGQELDKWVSGEQAMQLLNIKSKTTLQTLRDEGKIRFSQPQKKIILYDRDSINTYLEQNARNTF